MELTPQLKDRILGFQRSEITEHLFYKKLASRTKNQANREILEKISADELKHYNFWKSHTGVDVQPRVWVSTFYSIVARLLGITFATKLMEKGEKSAQEAYGEIAGLIPGTDEIIKDENEHEASLLRLLNEKYLQYVSSIVLGLNDALVELTGTLAGLTFALQNGKIVALAGFITGIAASFSMASAEFLSNRADGASRKKAFEASSFTGIAYLLVVLALIAPYVLGVQIYFALGITLLTGFVIIGAFSFYISVVKETGFLSQVSEMAFLSVAVTVISFLIGTAARKILGIEI